MSDHYENDEDKTLDELRDYNEDGVQLLSKKMLKTQASAADDLLDQQETKFRKKANKLNEDKEILSNLQTVAVEFIEKYGDQTVADMKAAIHGFDEFATRLDMEDEFPARYVVQMVDEALMDVLAELSAVAHKLDAIKLSRKLNTK